MAARSIRTSSRLFSLLAVVLLIAGCAGGTASPNPTTAPPTAAVTLSPPTVPPATPTAAFPVTLTDDEGTAVTIPAEPQKIVSLTPATTETLFALGVRDRVVGKVQDPAKFPPEANTVAEMATFNGVDVEKIVDAGADLVISGGTGLTQGDAVEQLRRANIPVIVSYPTTVEQGVTSIEVIGKAVGAAEEAAALAGGIRRRVDALAAIAATATDKPRLFYEIDVYNGIFTPPADSIYGEMFRLAGAEPISGDVAYSISLEDLIDADPEVILLGDTASGQSAETVKAREGWGGMTAVKNDRIVAVDDIVITRPGPRIADGLYALIAAIHPELAPSLPTATPS
ncbi:MAG TPA: ABC transporter substrate-binding protein [Candidatus Limnocylindria bacterium]|nr:ABC transporter substrate-binding protein [Candidatus Limnocylindria bacterium]